MTVVLSRMAIVFEKGSQEIMQLLRLVMEKYHTRLVAEEVNVGIICRTKFTSDDEEVPSLKLRGAPAYAIVKVVNRKRRAQIDSDAEIEIDLPVWKSLSAEKRVALLDHELTHLVISVDRKTDEPKKDDLGRQILKMRPDDFTLTGFLEVVTRHGKNALEYASVAGVNAGVMSAYQEFASNNAPATPQPDPTST